MLNSASTTSLIQSGFTSFSVSALTILGTVIGIGVALLVVYWGMCKLKRVASGEDLSTFESNLHMQNRKIADELMNSELLELGDKTQAISHWL